MGDFEKLTLDSLRAHMEDDPCVICGVAGHDAYGECAKVKTPASMSSPLSKIYSFAKANAARQQILKWRAQPRPAKIKKPATTDSDPQPGDDQTENDAKEEDRVLTDLVESVDKSVEGLKKVQDITQTDSVEMNALASSNLSGASKIGEGNAFKPRPAVSKTKQAQYPLRKEFAKTSSEVFTNHFEVNFKPGTRFFIYEILKIPTGKSKRKAMYIFKTAIEAWDFLRDNKQHFVTDNVKTIVAWKSLHESFSCTRAIPGDQQTQIGSVWMPDAIADGDEKIQLFIKYRRELDLAGLHAYIDASDNASNPDFNFHPIVDALNMAVTASLSTDVFQQSTNKFFVKCGSQALTGDANLKSLCTIRGYYYTLKPAMQKVLLNVNAATSAFFQPIRLDEYLSDATFQTDERLKLLKTLRLYIEPDRKDPKDPKEQEHADRLNKPQNRIKTFFEFGPKLKDRIPEMYFHKWFKDDQGQWVQDPQSTHVADHLRTVFGVPFDDNLPAINVGTKADAVYYPREYLKIMPYQIYKRLLPDRLVDGMLNQATHVPAHSRRLIEVEGMQSLGLDPTRSEQELPGCSQLLIKPTMLKIPSTKMERVEIIYGKNSANKTPNPSAQWNLQHLNGFLDTPVVKKGGRFNCLLLVESGMEDETNTINKYVGEFNNLLTTYGVCAGATHLVTSHIANIRNTDSTFVSLRSMFKDTITALCQAHTSANFAILLLKTRSIPAYSAFKDVVDRVVPMQSLCMTQAPNKDPESRAVRCKADITQYMANIMMKANLKQGGSNHTVKLEKDNKSQISLMLQDTLILGADLTHPSSNSLIGCPSIAAVVGSVDSQAGKWQGSMRLQNTCKKEIIDDLKDMVKERIAAYITNVRKVPKNILFYRDGVSTGQFAKVRDEELPQIKEACKEAGCGAVKVTVVVAVKRHHTRFYPATSLSAKNGNCVPGTLVDSAITSPHYSDFYLQSHHGLKGTAIPTHYVLIVNEIGYSDTTLQELTYKLCYTYARATIGVSYAPPAYYADRLCERGRSYLRNYFSPDKGSPHYQQYLLTQQGIEAQEATSLAQKIAALPVVAPRPGRNAARKSAEQVGIERAHKRRVDELLEARILGEARAAFNGTRTAPGPWGAELDESMFWM